MKTKKCIKCKVKDCKPFSSIYQNIMNETITDLSLTLSKNKNLIKK